MINVVYIIITFMFLNFFRWMKYYEFKSNYIRIFYVLLMFFPVLVNYYYIFMDGRLAFDFFNDMLPDFYFNEVIRWFSLVFCLYSGSLIPKHPDD